MDYQCILYDERDAGGWITFNRPEERNAISPRWIEEVGHALARANAAAQVRAIVLTGKGPAFCAGADLKAARRLLEKGGRVLVDEFLMPLTALLGRLRETPKPVIAAVNGHCLAGGMETILCCDLVVASASAVFSDQHALFGFLPAAGGAQGLARHLGAMKAKEMLFTGDRYSASDMAAAGLVNRVVPDAEMRDATEALVAQLAARSPSGLSRMKKMVNEEFELPWSSAARHELELLEAHLESGDVAEGMVAFAQKRKVRFGVD